MKTIPIANFDDVEALCLWRPSTYGVRAAVFDKDGNYKEFVFAYTSTTHVKGGVVVLNRDTGDAAGQNPRATKPENAAVGVQLTYGICAEDGSYGDNGIWVQTYGRCTYARTDACGVNDPLRATRNAYYLTADHTDTGTDAMIAIAEEAQANAIAAQDDTTNGDAEVTVFLVGRQATVP